MKIIHCADLHLGSRLTSLPRGNIRETRKSEILNSLNKIIDFAKKENVEIILLSGDVFDSDRPSKKDKNYFYNAIQANENIKFFYLRGNHDFEESYTINCKNLYTFNEEWSYYQINNIVISGIELSNNNKTSLYNTLSLKEDNINIVMMHGDISSSNKNFIDLKLLANKNIDYLALGHIHTPFKKEIDKRGVAIYSGCIEGRGFDEVGHKGFSLIEINDNKLEYKYISFPSRKIIKKDIDISEANNLYEAKMIVQSLTKDFESSSLVKINLIGKVKFDITDIEKDMRAFLKNNFFYTKIENKLQPYIDINKYQNDFSLKGEFVKRVLNNETYSLKTKEEIINLGLKFLNGEEVK